jgi:hypothetical protein
MVCVLSSSGSLFTSHLLVAATRKQAKSDDAKSTPKSTPKPPSKQLRSEEADTFRGVHLDPNAHHWDDVRCFHATLLGMI